MRHSLRNLQCNLYRQNSKQCLPKPGLHFAPKWLHSQVEACKPLAAAVNAADLVFHLHVFLAAVCIGQKTQCIIATDYTTNKVALSATSFESSDEGLT